MRINGVNSPNSISKLHQQKEESKLFEENFKKDNMVGINKENEANQKDSIGVSEEELINAIEKANKEFIVYDRKFEFSIHEETKEIMIKVIDASNNEVIREIPPEKILDMVAKMWELAGLIVDEKV